MPDETGAVTPIDIAELRDEASALKTYDMKSGGGLAETLQIVRRRGRAAQAMMSRGCASTLHQSRAEAVGWFLNNVAFMTHDAGRNSDASQLWFNAEATARESGKYSLVARIRSQKGRQELTLGQLALPYNEQKAAGHFSAAIALFESAIQQDHRGELSATELAALHALLARGYANVGDERFIAASRTAETFWFAQRNDWDLDGRPWWAHFDEPHFKGDLASAARAALPHDFRVAAAASALYEEAADAQAPQNRRSGVMNLASLGLVEATYGDLDRAVAFVKRALSAARHVRSQRVIDHFAILAQAFKPHGRRGDVSDVMGEIRSLVAA